MEDGVIFENDARTLYSSNTDTKVEQIAMFRDGPHKHASPDGVIGDDGLVEIKTVIPSTFVEYKDTGVIDISYRRQVQWELFVSGRKWCDYVIYCPAIEEIMAIEIKRVWRDEKEIYILNDGADMFIEEMLEMYYKITGKKEAYETAKG
ncbi:YqaJ viral recombinase family protein [bacterium]|nr:YqaJ viral recombinase family protein [bacterium]